MLRHRKKLKKVWKKEMQVIKNKHFDLLISQQVNKLP